MNQIKLQVVEVGKSNRQPKAFILVLKEEKGNRKLSIAIGPTEAQAIIFHLDGFVPPRPLTHDLFINLFNLLEIKLTEIVINTQIQGVFRSNIIGNQKGESFTLDSRTSDAVALALRFNAPIYIENELLEKNNREIESMTTLFKLEEEDEDAFFDLEELSNKELQICLVAAIHDEDYELASAIKSILDKRKK